MREIKFRAWDNLSKKIVAFNGRKWCRKYGQHINIQYATEKEDTVLKLISKFFYGSDLELIYMQYTGLKDKNGVEIYEGDIAIIENYNHHGKNPKKTMFIYYDDLTSQYCCRIKETVCKIDDLIMEHQPLCFAHSIEVIGNIYENPDLLKED